MTGLILKDFLILRKTLRTYLLFLAVYVVLAFSGVWSPEFVSGFIMVMIAVLPMNVFAYDQQAKWDTYGLALPVGRTKTVAARYLCVLILCLSTVVLECVFGAVLFAAGKLEDVGEYLFSGAVCGLMAALVNAILLPFLYKFGPERARIVLIGVVGIIFAALAAVFVVIPKGDGVVWLETLSELQTAAIPVIGLLAGLVLLAVSFLLSRHFYGRKDV